MNSWGREGGAECRKRLGGLPFVRDLLIDDSFPLLLWEWKWWNVLCSAQSDETHRGVAAAAQGQGKRLPSATRAYQTRHLDPDQATGTGQHHAATRPGGVRVRALHHRS